MIILQCAYTRFCIITSINNFLTWEMSQVSIRRGRSPWTGINILAGPENEASHFSVSIAPLCRAAPKNSSCLLYKWAVTAFSLCWCDDITGRDHVWYAAVQRQKAVSVHYTSEQILPFGLVQRAVTRRTCHQWSLYGAATDPPVRCTPYSRHNTLNQCWFNVGPAS